jgi:hypothetical protein
MPTPARRPAPTIALIFALQAAARLASADPPGIQDDSDRLFYEGNELMKKSDFHAACARFEQSLALRRRGGTLLNLALCREAEGDLAAALPLFEEALEIASRDGHTDRRDFAQRHVDDLRSRRKIPAEAPAAAPPPAPAPAPPAAPPAPAPAAAPAPPSAPPAPAPPAAPGPIHAAPPAPAPAPARDEALAHRLQIGAMTRLDIDPIHPGARFVAGLTFGVDEHLEIGASALLGREVGFEPQLTFFLGRSALKPLLNAGVPIFFVKEVDVGVRGSLGVQWDVGRHFGLFVQAGGAYFPNAAAGYAKGVLLPSLGAQGRI